jgi:3D (Asp-Asp-Asp) domain-containing protein
MNGVKRLYASIIVAVIIVCTGYFIAYHTELPVETTDSRVTVTHIIHVNVTVTYVDTPFETYEVTAYTANVESTGKTTNDPLYGVTASGEYVKERHSVACPRSIPFGSTVYIPFLAENADDDGVYVCVDRGSAITDGRIDVYKADLADAITFGRRELPVLILPPSSGGETVE